MLSLRRIADALQGRAIPKGWLAVIALANFHRIADSYGIPAVQRTGDHLAELIVRSAPADAFVGAVNWTAFAVSLPAATHDDVAAFATRIRAAAMDDDLELERGVWVEIHVVVGAMEVCGDEPNTWQVIEAAVRLAEQDFARFPAGWSYPIA